MNALANEEVGKYLNEHCISSFQKVGTFRIAGGQKQGGNVASYFCTPEGNVLHIIAGPVNASTMLREARWAVETWKLTMLGEPERDYGRSLFHKAHLERLQREHGVDGKRIGLPSGSASPAEIAYVLNQGIEGRRKLSNQGKVHLLLAIFPLAKLEQIYIPVFEKVLNEKVSTLPVVGGG